MTARKLYPTENPATLGEQLDMVARKLETRAGLEIAELRPERAREWAAIVRRAQAYIGDESLNRRSPRGLRGGRN